MSIPVDERVVSMDFDNKRFEKNVSQSMSTIDRLKNALNFRGSEKSLNSLKNTANNMNFNGLEKGIDTVRVKFDALQVMGIRALSNITDTAMRVGKRLVDALTLDPITTGFREYETQINAVQTILANTSSKGTTIDQVNRALDELNMYADKTIYNFTEMTRNIGTFTAAGVGLQTSVNAIKGISNLAAVSGSTAQQASTAMYQLSQALAAGTVKLQDWNSVVNAGMGGEVFQNALKETARIHGIKIDQMIKKEGSFRETLKSGWITSGLLTETLSKFTGDLNEQQLKAIGYSEQQIADIIKLGKTANDAATKVKTFTQLFDTLTEAAQSGWAKSWQIIIGDFEEAKALFTEVGDTLSTLINKASDARNQILSGGLTSEWSRFAETWNNKIGDGSLGLQAFEENIKAVAREHGIAVDEMIATDGSFEKSLRRDWLTTDLVKESMDRFTNSVSSMSEEQLKAEGYTLEHIKSMKAMNVEIQNGSVDVLGFTDNLDKMSGRENIIESFRNVFKGLFSVIKPVNDSFRETFEFTSDDLYGITVALKELTSNLVLTDKQVSDLGDTFKGLFAVVDIFTTFAGGGFTIALRLLRTALSALDIDILEFTGSVGNYISAFRDWLFENELIIKGFEKLETAIVSGVHNIRTYVSNFLALKSTQKVLENIADTFSQLTSGIGKYLDDGKERIDGFIKLIQSMDDGLTMDNAVRAVKYLKDNIVSYLGNIGSAFENMTGFMDNFKQTLKDNIESAGIDYDNLERRMGSLIDLTKLNFNAIGLGEALTIGLGVSLIMIINKLSNLVEALAKPVLNFTALMDGVNDVLKAHAKLKASEALLNTAKAITLLAVSVGLLALLDQKKVWSSVGAIGALSVGLIAFSAALGALSKYTVFTKVSATLLSIGGAILLLSAAMKNLNELDPNKLLQNGVVLVGLASTLLAFGTILSKAAPALSGSGMVFLTFSASLLLLVKAMKNLEGLDAGKIETTMQVLLAATIALATISMAAGGLTLGSAATILAASVSLKMLIDAIDEIASMDTKTIIDNIENFIVVFGMYGGLIAISKLAGQNSAKAGIGMLAMTTAIILMSTAIKSIGAIDPGSVDRALDVIIKLLAVFGAVIGISKLAGANAIKAGVMISLLTASIVALTVSIAVLSLLKPDGLERATKSIVMLQGMFALIIGITKLAANAKATIAMISTSIAVLAVTLAGLSMVKGDGLKQATDSMVMMMAMFSIMVASTSLARGAFTTILVMSLVVAEIAAVMYLLSDMPLGNTLEIAKSLSIVLLSMSGACLILAAAGAFIVPALAGIVLMDVLIANLGLVLIGLGKLSEMFPGAEALLDKGIPILDKIGRALGSAVGNFIGGVTGGFATGATQSLAQVGINLTNFMLSMQPFFAMVEEIDTTAIDGVKNLADVILMLTKADIISKVTSFITGGASLSAFGEQLQAFGTQYVAFANSVNSITNIEGVNNSVAAIKALAEVAGIIPNSGGLIGIFAGENNWVAFGAGLAEFGKAIKEYGTSVTGLAISEIIASKDAVQTLAEVGYMLPNSGGLIGLFAGDNNWPVFGNGLSAFGKALFDYGSNVTGLAISSITNSAIAVRALAEVAALIPNGGGILSLFSGDNTFKSFGKGLGDFSSALQTYATNVTGLNIEVINGSVQAATELANITALDFSGLANFSNAIKEFVGTPIEQFIQKLQNGAKSVREQAGKLLDGLAEGMTDSSKTSNLKQDLSSVMDDNVSNLDSYEDDFRKSGNNAMDGFVLGVSERIGSIKETTANAALAGLYAFNDALGIHSPSWEYEKSGMYSEEGYKAGWQNAAPGLANTITGIPQEALDSVKALIPEYKAAGGDSARGWYNQFTNGLGQAGNYVMGFIEKPLKTAGDAITDNFNGYQKKAEESMSNMVSGMANKLGSSGSKAKIKSALDKLKEWIDEEKFYNRLTLEQELDKWLEVQAKYAAGSEERKQIDREVYRLRNEIIKDTYDKEKKYIEDEVFFERKTLSEQLTYWIGLQEKYNALGEEYATQREETNRKVFELQKQTAADAYSQEKQWIDDKKYYNQMSLDEELGYWKGIQAQFLAGSEERKNAAKEVYRVEKELAKEAYDNAKKWIDDRLYYEEMNLSEELYTWEHLQDMYEEGSEERKEADREVFRLNKEINAAREENTKAIADLEEETAQKRIDLEQEYYDKTKEVNDKMAADIEALNKQYDDAVKQRADSIYSAYNLFDYAKEGGNVEGSVLLTNLGSQVTALEDWQKEINSLGDRGIAEGLLDELRAMGPSSMAEIKAINSLTDEQLTKYVDLWQQKHELAKNQAIFELDDLKMETTTKIEEIKEAARIELESYKNTWDTELAALNANAEARLEELRVAFDEKVGTVSSETKRTVRNLTRDIEDAIDVSATEIEDRTTDMAKNIQTAMETPDWVSIGTNIIAGITKGIQDKAGELAAAAAKAARDALEAAEAELDINSPSGEFEWVGLQCIRGMVLGFSKNSALVMNEASAVGSSVVNSINGAISKIAEGVQYGFDPNPTIRPVVDLSNVSTGLSQIRAMFSREQALIVGLNTPQTNNQQNQNGVNNPNKGAPQPQFIQNNYSPKALSRTEIYRQTKNQFSAFERMVNT